MLDWIRKTKSSPEDPMRNPASASALLAELREADPVTALDDLRNWLDPARCPTDLDERVRSEVLGLIQEAGAAHVAALVRQYLADTPDKQVLRESKWKSLFAYASSLTEALCASAARLLAMPKKDASDQGAGAAGAVRALRACRTLAKVCLVHYASIPASLWRSAYAVHAGAEAAGCATIAAHPHRNQRTSTTATQELLRLLMLQVSAPETLAPEQVEVADRVVERFGDEFTLRARGVADSPFRFDPEGDLPPQRASGASVGQNAAGRSFGPGAALDTLARFHKQMIAAGVAAASAFGRDIASHAQFGTVEHLLACWGPTPPHAPPAHAPAKGELQVVHRYAQICTHLAAVGSAAGDARGLGIASEDDAKREAPEAWAVRDAGGSEVGAELPRSGAHWARCGHLLAFSVRGRNEWWVGAIRRMHAEVGKPAHVDIALLSRKPLAVALRAQAKGVGEGAGWEASSETSAHQFVSAILLPDASQALGTPNLLLPLEGWREGWVYEAVMDETARQLRILHVLQRGEDFVRVAFEWLAAPVQ